MFNIGELVIYSAHGICKIDDICEKTISGITRTYYVLHPMDNNHKLTFSIPVQKAKFTLLELTHQEEATKILDSFKYPGIEWNDKPNLRISLFADILSKGDRKEIAKAINTLMRKKIELGLHERKLYEQDRKFLNQTQNILFKELAISLNTSYEEINERVLRLITE